MLRHDHHLHLELGKIQWILMGWTRSGWWHPSNWKRMSSCERELVCAAVVGEATMRVPWLRTPVVQERRCVWSKTAEKIIEYQQKIEEVISKLIVTFRVTGAEVRPSATARDLLAICSARWIFKKYFCAWVRIWTTVLV